MEMKVALAAIDLTTGSRFLRARIRRTIVTAIVPLLMIVGCNGDSGDGSATGLELIADPPTVKAGGTSTITVMVLDSDGDAAPDGTAVALSASPALGTLANAALTTVAGEAATLFTAGETEGSVVISATCGAATTSITLTIGARIPASIELIAEPATVKTGATTTITARVRDADGETLPDGTAVSLSVSPALGALTNTAPTTVAGEARTVFTAGAIAGQAVITATSGAISTDMRLTIEAHLSGTVRITVEGGKNGYYALEVVAGYFQSIDGGAKVWTPTMQDGATRDMVLPVGGARYRYLFKACGYPHWIYDPGDTPTFEWEGELDVPEGAVSILRLDSKKSIRTKVTNGCNIW